MTMESFIQKAGVFSPVLSYVGAAALFGMMTLTTVDVIFRYAFNSPILGAFEVTEFLVLLVIFSFLGYTQSQKSHISVDLLFNLFPKKLQTVIEVFNHAICLFLMILIAWMGIVNALDLMEAGEGSPNLGIPDYPFAFFLVLGCIITCIEFARDCIQMIMDLKEEES